MAGGKERGRLERNVLRLLDSKDPAMVALNTGAPPNGERSVYWQRRGPAYAAVIGPLG